jgi:hypothetical protein
MMLPFPQRKKISTLEMPVSPLNTQLMVSPVNASRQLLRTQGLTFEDIAAKNLDRVIDRKTDSLHSSTERADKLITLYRFLYELIREYHNETRRTPRPSRQV